MNTCGECGRTIYGTMYIAEKRDFCEAKTENVFILCGDCYYELKERPNGEDYS